MHFLVSVHLPPISGDTAPNTWRVAKAKEQGPLAQPGRGFDLMNKPSWRGLPAMRPRHPFPTKALRRQAAAWTAQRLPANAGKTGGFLTELRAVFKRQGTCEPVKK